MTLLVGACTVIRVEKGAELRADPERQIVAGQTTKAELLARFGAPDAVLRTVKGETLRYSRRWRIERRLEIADPIVTNFKLLSYTEQVERSEVLLVLLDPLGVVSEFAYDDGSGRRSAQAARGEAGPER